MGAIDTDGVTPTSSVRFLVGDSIAPYTLSDAEIAFALDQMNDNTYLAAAFCARALAASYARRVDTRFEDLESKYSQLRDSYEKLARNLEYQAKKQGGIGVPLAGGLTRSEVETATENTDRLDPYFYDGMFDNGIGSNDR